MPKVRRPLPEDEGEDRQIRRDYRQHGCHEHLTIIEAPGFPSTGHRNALKSSRPCCTLVAMAWSLSPKKRFQLGGSWSRSTEVPGGRDRSDTTLIWAVGRRFLSTSWFRKHPCCAWAGRHRAVTNVAYPMSRPLVYPHRLGGPRAAPGFQFARHRAYHPVNRGPRLLSPRLCLGPISLAPASAASALPWLHTAPRTLLAVRK